MNPDIHREVIGKLDRDYQFKPSGGWLRQGKCPNCGKKELYTNQEHPWVIRCGRLNNCGVEYHVKELYPELFEDWSGRYQKTPENPNAAADAYLQSARGFDLSKIAGWYTQESYYDRKLDIGSATVRFPLAGGDYWERLIDHVARFGDKKAHFNFGAGYKGTGWSLPGVTMPQDEIWIVEGIFDAIALHHHDIWAMSAMSCNNYPHLFLAGVAEQCKAADRKRPKLVWALDAGKAGEEYAKRWVTRSRQEGWTASAALIVSEGKVKLDWNDAHQRDRLQPKHLDEYRYNGKLLTAHSAEEKALLIYNRNNWASFFFDFDHCLYWFEMDFAAYNKAQEAIKKQWDAEEKTYSKEELRDKALQGAHNVKQIANCNPTALYYQANSMTDESWYYLKVDFPHDGQAVKNTFTGSQLSSSSEFKKRLLAIAPGAVYTGSAGQLDAWLKRQLYGIKTVQTIDFIGYSKDHGAWVFNNLAVKEGRIVEINEEDFFDIGKLSIKSLNQSVTLAINNDPKEYAFDWIRALWTCFRTKGIVALAFWLGSLYAEQIRAEQKSYPFLEVVGEPGSGKSTLIEFLWKLYGRADYEGFDPSKSTLAARARSFAQVANLPVVLIESDRDSGDSIKQKSFDWDELKTAYNGRSVRSTGVKNGGNDTREPPFRGAIVISQNATVAASDAMMQRLVHLDFDTSSHNTESIAAAEKLEKWPVEQISGFILRACKAEAAVMETVRTKTTEYAIALAARPGIKSQRIAKNHAQLMALVDALSSIAKINEEQHRQTHDHIVRMAEERQLAINADTPAVQAFWEIFDFLESDGDDDSLLNHARSAEEIAINLNHFVQIAADRRQQIPDINELKKVLRTSRLRKFIAIKPVNSAINRDYNARKPEHAPSRPSSVNCWVFKKS